MFIMGSEGFKGCFDDNDLIACPSYPSYPIYPQANKLVNIAIVLNPPMHTVTHFTSPKKTFLVITRKSINFVGL